MRFPVTHRSILERVRSREDGIRRTAFGDLADAYWRPSYHYLRLHWRLAPDAAEDVVQGFFTTAFEKRYLDRYDPAQAKFRTFLRTCLDRYVQNVWKAERALKRGGAESILSLDFPGAERELAAITSRDLSDVERFFHDETIRWLFTRTVETLRRAFAAEGRETVFAVFEHHDLKPTADVTYARVGAELGLTTAQVTNYLHAVRKRFKEAALTELRSICGSDDEFRTEARQLFGVEIDE